MPLRAVTRAEDGQAAVELVALLPVIILVVALSWQGVVAGQAFWMAGSAARAAARARALGADPVAAARRALPPGLAGGTTVSDDGDGVRVRIRVPAVVGHAALGSVQVRARMEPQT